MRIRDKITGLWRDRYEYDPVAGAPGAGHHVSLWTRLKPTRKRITDALFNGAFWAGVITTLAGVFLAHYLDGTKPDKQVQANAGELHLQCVKKADGVLACREVSAAKH